MYKEYPGGGVERFWFERTGVKGWLLRTRQEKGPFYTFLFLSHYGQRLQVKPDFDALKLYERTS
jgi:hypothetical protein